MSSTFFMTSSVRNATAASESGDTSSYTYWKWLAKPTGLLMAGLGCLQCSSIAFRWDQNFRSRAGHHQHPDEVEAAREENHEQFCRTFR